MTTTAHKTPKIIALASRLEDDIREKNLAAGAPYLSTVEAARMLGTSTVAANRALQLLVKRNVIHRSQRSGSFVAEANATAETSTVDRVHLLVHQNFLKVEGLLGDGVIVGIQEKLPQAEILFNFLPTNDEESYTNRLVSEAMSSRRKEGFVLVRAPLEVQRIVQACGMPAVIHGMPFPSISTAWIDRDHYQAGRLAAADLLRRGFRSITIFTRERPLPGDFPMTDGVRDEMHAAGLPLNAIAWRALPSDPVMVKQAVLDILQHERGKHGFVCRSRPLADAAAAAVAAEGMQLSVDAGIVVLDVYQIGVRQEPPYPYLMLTLSPEQIGRQVGEMLFTQAQGARPEPNSVVIPLQVCEGINGGGG